MWHSYLIQWLVCDKLLSAAPAVSDATVLWLRAVKVIHPWKSSGTQSFLYSKSMNTLDLLLLSNDVIVSVWCCVKRTGRSKNDSRQTDNIESSEGKEVECKVSRDAAECLRMSSENSGKERQTHKGTSEGLWRGQSKASLSNSSRAGNPKG